MSAMSEIDATHGQLYRRLLSARLSLESATDRLEKARKSAATRAVSEYEDIARIDSNVRSALAALEITLEDLRP